MITPNQADAALPVRDLLFTLLVKVGVAASFAALLARWTTLRRVLFTEERDADQKLKLMLFMTPPLIVGVTLRLLNSAYRFADLSIEGAFLMGLLGGRVVGPIGGAIITIPALISHEWLAVAAPLKIWNNTRIEMNLERHQQLLLKARMDALSSQINPHFLFNTLNTVSALIRFDPDTARGVVLKLSNILRRLLRKHETFVPLKEELQFIDDYLDIEVARFGKDNLEIIKEIDDDTLEAFVPSMLLQPMVENCLKHGLAPKIEGGRIRLHAEQRDGRLRVEIEDNGVGSS